MTCFSPSLLVALSTWPLLQPPAAEGETWPQYHGPHGNRSVAAELDLDRWKEDGPPVAWRVPTELGFSSFAIADGQALTLVRRDEGGEGREVCVALDVETGETRWSTAVGPATYDGGGDAGADGNKGGDGPRSTPSIVGDAVYVFDASFTITCLAAKDGEVRWKHSLTTENEAADIRWQNAAAPVVHDGRLFVAGSGEGQSLLALDARDGSVIWKTGTETPTHATPVVCDLHGVTRSSSTSSPASSPVTSRRAPSSGAPSIPSGSPAPPRPWCTRTWSMCPRATASARACSGSATTARSSSPSSCGSCATS